MSISKSASLALSHALPLHPAEDRSELWEEKKGSLVQSANINMGEEAITYELNW